MVGAALKYCFTQLYWLLSDQGSTDQSRTQKNFEKSRTIPSGPKRLKNREKLGPTRTWTKYLQKNLGQLGPGRAEFTDQPRRTVTDHDQNVFENLGPDSPAWTGPEATNVLKISGKFLVHRCMLITAEFGRRVLDASMSVPAISKF